MRRTLKQCDRAAIARSAFLIMVFSFVVSFFLPRTALCATKQVKIGVLAYRGNAEALKMWSPTATYLDSAIPGYSFTIIPLGFNEIVPAVGRGDVDFLLANTSIYVEVEAQFGISRIATLENQGRGGGYTVFGGVIFCRADRNDIQDLSDLKGKTFMAVDETSLGGWRVAWRELKASGIDPYRDFKKLSFGVTHDAVVLAVLNGTVDGGTVRSDTLERMAEEGKIGLSAFRVLNKQSVPGFPFVLSTRLYPEWPLARLRSTNDDLAQEVVIALLKMRSDSPAAKAAKITGWTVPLDYEPVHALLRELRLGPYKDYGKVTMAEAVRQYWYWVVLGLLALLGMAAVTVYVSGLNRRLASARQRLEDAGKNLSQQVQERTAELRQTNEDLNREIIERREAEKRITKSEEFNRSILNSVDEGFIVVDREYRIMTVNRAYCGMVGKRADEVIGRPCHEISHRQPRPCFLDGEECAVRAVFETGQPHVVVHRHETPSGEITFAENRAYPLRDPDGAVVSAIEVINNITERHLLEEERLKTQKLESIGTLAGGIAHDFNNLLQGVLGYISLARLTAADREKSEEALENAEKALSMSVKLTGQLLTFSKGGKPVKRLIDLRHVIESAAGFALSGSNSECRIVAEDGLWQVEADEGQVGQVVQNIVLNAVQAMPRGGCVEIIAENVKGEDMDTSHNRHGKQWICIAIKDTGVGIPEQNLARIFDPYFTTKEKGSGLGLATSYAIIKNHQGMIEVRSEVGKGTTFLVYLPAAGAAIQAGDVQQKPLSTPGRSLKVLVMDDEKVVRDVAGELLKALGHAAEFAAHGDEAIEKYRNAQAKGKPFDIVILDLTIRGGKGGAETMRRLQEITPGVRAVVSSGYSDDEMLAEFREKGFTAYLKKPYSMQGLQKALHTAYNA